MNIECVCGDWHPLTAAGMAVVIFGFQAGDLTNVGKNGMTTCCILEAFTEENKETIRRRYRSHRLLMEKEK